MTGKIITVTQQKGGSGKTTIAAHLAIAFRDMKKTVAVLDTDPQGSLCQWFMAREEAMEIERDELCLKTASAFGARYEAKDLAKSYDIVILDTPPKLGYDAKPAMQSADLVIAPVAPSPVDLWATKPVVEMAEECKKPLLMVMNRVNAQAKLTGEMKAALKELGTDMAKASLGSRVAFAASMGQGKTVTETDKSGLAAREITALAAEIFKRLKKL